MAVGRGQSAVEYMMTYGWGILVVLIAGILLYQMGFLQLSQDVTPDKRGFSQLTPLDWSLTPVGDTYNLTVVIQNNAGTIVSISRGTASMVAGGSGDCNPLALSVDNFRPGSTQKLVFEHCPLDAGTKIGSYYRVNVTVDYANPASGLPHRSNGVIWGPVG